MDICAEFEVERIQITSGKYLIESLPVASILIVTESVDNSIKIYPNTDSVSDEDALSHDGKLSAGYGDVMFMAANMNAVVEVTSNAVIYRAHVNLG